MSKTPEMPPAADIQYAAMFPNTTRAKAIKSRIRAIQHASARDQLAGQIAELEKAAPERPTDAEMQIAAFVKTAPAGSMFRERTLDRHHPDAHTVAKVTAYRAHLAKIDSLRERHQNQAQLADSAHEGIASADAQLAHAAAVEALEDRAKRAREELDRTRFAGLHGHTPSAVGEQRAAQAQRELEQAGRELGELTKGE